MSLKIYAGPNWCVFSFLGLAVASLVVLFFQDSLIFNYVLRGHYRKCAFGATITYQLFSAATYKVLTAVTYKVLTAVTYQVLTAVSYKITINAPFPGSPTRVYAQVVAHSLYAFISCGCCSHIRVSSLDISRSGSTSETGFFFGEAYTVFGAHQSLSGMF